MAKRLLLTGATGFVGRNLLLELLKRDCYEEILLPVRDPQKLRSQLQEDGWCNLPRQLFPIRSSAPDWGLKNVQVDHVVHAAGILFGLSESEYFATNTEGTLNLLRALGPAPERTVVLSSLSAAGPCPPGQPAKSESDADQPITWYGKSKLEMERRVGQEYPDWNFVFLRPPMILGARDQATLPLFRMARGFVQLKPGWHPKHYSFIAVDDLVEAILVLLDPKRPWPTLTHRHFFIASASPISDIDLLEGAAKVSSRHARLLRIPHGMIRAASRVVSAVPAWRSAVPSLSADRAREIWPDRWVISPAAFEQQFGWQARTGLLETLGATRDWYLKSGKLLA